MTRRLSAFMLVVVAVLFAGVAALSAKTNHSYVTTPSMYPTIPPGSEIFVTPQTHYHVGQVIEFHANGLTWAHRLVKINPDGTFVTKGDNPQNAPDVFVPALTQKDVIGAVTHAPRWLGFPELILHHPSYGLAWLRAELGLLGKILFVAVVGLISLLLAWMPRRRSRRPSVIDLVAAETETGSAAARGAATRPHVIDLTNGATSSRVVS